MISLSLSLSLSLSHPLSPSPSPSPQPQTNHVSAAPSFSEAMRQGAEVYQKLKTLAKKKYGQSAGNVGDEGGVAPDIQTAEEALELIAESIEQAGYTGKVHIAMDVASSEFYKEE